MYSGGDMIKAKIFPLRNVLREQKKTSAAKAIKAQVLPQTICP